MVKYQRILSFIKPTSSSTFRGRWASIRLVHTTDILDIYQLTMMTYSFSTPKYSKNCKTYAHDQDHYNGHRHTNHQGKVCHLIYEIIIFHGMKLKDNNHNTRFVYMCPCPSLAITLSLLYGILVRTRILYM